MPFAHIGFVFVFGGLDLENGAFVDVTGHEGDGQHAGDDGQHHDGGDPFARSC